MNTLPVIKTAHTDAIIASVKKARGNRPFIVMVARPANPKK